MNMGKLCPFRIMGTFYGVLCVVTMVFIFIASYKSYMDDRVLRDVRYYPYNLTFVRDSAMKDVRITEVEFSRRRVPDLRELLEIEPHIFSVIPSKFLTDIRNPCWYEEYFGNVTSDPYMKNRYGVRLWSALKEHLFTQGDKQYRLRCLPYFYVLGQPKCGTTDLYARLRRHPDVRFTIMKEPHWWAGRRFAMLLINPSGPRTRISAQNYLDLLDPAAFEILDRSHSKNHISQQIIVGEASISTLWENNPSFRFYRGGAENEPHFLVPDLIHAVQPNAKLIVTLRNPAERLYSDYLYSNQGNTSPEEFHLRVLRSLRMFEACVSEHSLRSCVYNTSFHITIPETLHVSLYVLYILDWLSVYNKEQILFVRVEDQAANCTKSLHKIMKFLDLRPLSEEQEDQICTQRVTNARKSSDSKKGPMLPVTRDILQQFFHPFNQTRRCAAG